MRFPEDFPIAKKWQPQHADHIQLYSLPTPNGVKISAMLEETGLAYDPHFVSLADNDQHSLEFLSLNPNNKIPAIIDPKGPGDEPIGLWESGSILIYLAEKSGKLLPQNPHDRHQALQWLMFQIGGAGPMFGQFGHFHTLENHETGVNSAHERFRRESIRLLEVINQQLEKSEYLACNEYTIADIALWPWIRILGGYYKASEPLELARFEAMNTWLEKCSRRPASEQAKRIPSKEKE